jgi:hypothetical protein
MVKQTRNIISIVEDLKSIMICDLFYKVALDTIEPLLKRDNGNKYILMAINHYSKWCEAKLIPDCTTSMSAKYLHEEFIYKYKVPKFVLIDNGGEWSTEFDNLCKVHNIHH